jgi:hypothetical protein
LRLCFKKGILHFKGLCTGITFCFRLGRVAAEIYKKLKLAIGKETVGRIQMFVSLSKFGSGVPSVYNAEHSGQYP